jgi:hypothetical protein
VQMKRTRIRTNTNPNGTEANLLAEVYARALRASQNVKRAEVYKIKLVIFTRFFCSSAECPFPAAASSRGRKKWSGHRPGHHDHGRATEAIPNDPTSSKVDRRECHLASVRMKLVLFTLLLCSSAESSSPDAVASRRRRERSKQRPEHQDQVRATHSETPPGPCATIYEPL